MFGVIFERDITTGPTQFNPLVYLTGAPQMLAAEIDKLREW